MNPAVRFVLAEFGDFSVEPLVRLPCCDGTSIVKLSLEGSGNGLPELLAPPKEWGESPVEEGDILVLCRLAAVNDAVARSEVMNACTEPEGNASQPNQRSCKTPRVSNSRVYHGNDEGGPLRRVSARHGRDRGVI